MVDSYDGYTGRGHLVWRNLVGLVLGGVAFLGIWLSANPDEDWLWRTLIGALFGGMAWVGVMFVSAKGH